ncbi:Aminotransferase-like, plant mobile domain [Sesbania bispinosa]|nr:Aminotransferase-like, plant mobile domain [Sesbania bispinosa]
MEATTSNKKHKKLSVDAVQPREVQKYCGVKLHWKVREKLQGSGFEYMFDLAHKVNTCKPLLVALTRTYQPQSGLFLFGEQQELELFFSLQDIFRITGLPIDGEPVSIEDVKLKVGEFCSLTGLECDKPVISLQTLVDAINMSYDDVNDMDEVRLNQICRIVALLGIGCMIMQETKSTIKIKYICLLRKVECIKDYAWGAAAWANLHSSLIEIKKGYGTQLYGSVVSLMDRGTQSLYNLSFPMMIEFSNIIGRDEMVNNYNQTQTSEFEAVLMTLTKNDIIWTYEDLPPTSHNNYYDQEELGSSVTTAIADSFAVKHQPHLAPRQFPLFNPRNKILQRWVEELPTMNVGRKKKKGSLELHKNLWEQRWSRLISLHDEDEQDSPNPSQHGAEVQVLMKKLLVLDINGLLAHIVYANPNQYQRRPDAIRGKNASDGGGLRTFLEGLANAENMRNYIQENAFGQPPITETSQEWQYYQKVLNSLSTGQA